MESGFGNVNNGDYFIEGEIFLNYNLNNRSNFNIIKGNKGGGFDNVNNVLNYISKFLQKKFLKDLKYFDLYILNENEKILYQCYVVLDMQNFFECNFGKGRFNFFFFGYIDDYLNERMFFFYYDKRNLGEENQFFKREKYGFFIENQREKVINFNNDNNNNGKIINLYFL